jgi:hypothetical protein
VETETEGTWIQQLVDWAEGRDGQQQLPFDFAVIWRCIQEDNPVNLAQVERRGFLCFEGFKDVPGDKNGKGAACSGFVR